MPDIDADGLVLDNPGLITTWSGGTIDPLRPEWEDVKIEDIAHALARLCRYNGHTGGFLSVARHSIWVSERLEERYPMLMNQWELALAGLLHDGAEAYLSDVPRPVKHQLTDFMAYDARMDAVVMDAFGLDYPLDPLVAEADHYVLMEVELPDPAGARWTWNGVPQEDERDFLKRYHLLQDRIMRIGHDAKRPRLIGLSGYARSGKDSVAKILGRYGYLRVAFADKLKDIALGIDPVVLVHGDAPELSHPRGPDNSVMRFKSSRVSTLQAWGADEDWLKEHTDYRTFLQRLGNEVRSVLGTSTWVDAALEPARSDAKRKLVISDVRYPNEADAIRALGGAVLRVNRPGTEPANDHVSEHAMDGYDFDGVVENDADRHSLDFRVHRTLEAL